MSVRLVPVTVVSLVVFHVSPLSYFSINDIRFPTRLMLSMVVGLNLAICELRKLMLFFGRGGGGRVWSVRENTRSEVMHTCTYYCWRKLNMVDGKFIRVVK